jgi:hypothetical protein
MNPMMMKIIYQVLQLGSIFFCPGISPFLSKKRILLRSINVKTSSILGQKDCVTLSCL